VPYSGFKTLDGDILFGGGNDRLFALLCTRLGHPEWATDPRFVTNSKRVENRNIIEGLIESVTRTKTTAEWLRIFEGSGMPYSAINDIQTTMKHEHGAWTLRGGWILTRSELIHVTLVLARNMVTEIDHPACGPLKMVNTPVKYSYSTPGIRSPPPLLGEHTDEVLREVLGSSEEEIEQLRREGVLA
jgi:succinate--hydroxymethylglutarate CoA-transferase